MTVIHEQFTPIIEALITLRRAEAAADEAYKRKAAAEMRLAEIVGTRRRDKDMGFDAEFSAHDVLIKALMSAHGYTAP